MSLLKMKLRPSLALLFLLALPAFGGTNVSGGGFLVSISGDRPFLLDFAELTSVDHDNPNPHAIQLGKVAEQLGYERLLISSLDAAQLATSRLTLWGEATPFLVKTLRDALDAIIWRFTAHTVNTAEYAYVLPSSLTASGVVVKPVVYFDSELGPFVDTQLWNTLSLRSQAGLLIHEALRHVQLVYRLDIDTQRLQRMTAKLMLTRPSDYSDPRTILEGDFLEMERRESDLKKDLSQVFHSICITSQSFSQSERTSKRKFSVPFSEIQQSSCGKLEPSVRALYVIVDQLQKNVNNSIDADFQRKISGLINDECFPVLEKALALSMDATTHSYVDATRGLDHLKFNIDLTIF